jgi:Spy/CpxP family protein refolding chaperone
MTKTVWAAVAVGVFAALAPAMSPASFAQDGTTTVTNSGVCERPAPPRFPREGQALTLEQLDWTRDQRDRFLSASGRYLNCLDREIETRMRAMMQSNTEDPRVNAAGAEHQNGSAAVGEAIKRFALLCYDYEGRSGVAYVPGCLPNRG